MRAQLRPIRFSVTDVPHYRYCLRDATEQMERSRHLRSGPVGCSWEPTRERMVDTIRCARVQVLGLGQNELPVPPRCSEVEMARVRARRHSVPSG